MSSTVSFEKNLVPSLSPHEGKPSLSDYDFILPEERIALFPPEDRTSARLLYTPRESGNLSHHTFSDIPLFFQKGDVLVLNNTRVLPARIFGRRKTGGKVEALLLKRVDANRWEALLRPGGRIKKDMLIEFGENGVSLEARVLDDARLDSGGRWIEFADPDADEKLKKIGHIPLPPYLDRPDTPLDREMYQTVFAEKEGAVAAPTAGLHFNQALLETLRAKDVEIVFVTLHTGYGTFQPVTEEDITRHRMFSEWFEVSEAAAHQINKALDEKRRVIACGTTSVRTLESATGEDGRIHAQTGETRLFIYPPYDFKIVSGMITNFHLPKSSLLLLVAALLGRDKLFQAYAEAIREGYQFYSYGDAMLIL